MEEEHGQLVIAEPWRCAITILYTIISYTTSHGVVLSRFTALLSLTLSDLSLW